MSIESPLFQSSLELLGHSITHFNSGKELDRKLVILHLANSIELILKDLVLDNNESIYKTHKETITVHSCIETLKKKNIILPHLNKIELLIDERNALQHRFGSPNELTTIFYMNIAIEFYREILIEYYSQEFEEVIKQFIDDKDLFAFQAREPRNDSELENLKQLAKLHPLGALLSANAYLDKINRSFYKSLSVEREAVRFSLMHPLAYRTLEKIGVSIPANLREKLQEVRMLRNMSTHGGREPNVQEVSKTITAIEELEKFLTTLNLEEITKNAKEHILIRDKERQKENEDREEYYNNQ